MPVPINTANFLAVSLLGAALLWAVRLVYGTYRGPTDDLPKRLMLLGGWVLLIGGVLGALPGLLGPLTLIPLFGLLIAGMAYFKYMSGERQALLWALAAAAERGIPLEQAARAFAEERSLQLGLRAARLAGLLEDGVPLPAALEMSRNPLPAEVLLAARLGVESGQMGRSLAMAQEHGLQFDEIIRNVLARYCYLLALTAFLGGILSFLMLKIVPVFDKMFQEFDLQLPALTQRLVDVSQALMFHGALLGVPLAVLLNVLLFGLVAVAAAYYAGWSRYELPLLQRFWRRCDSSLVLRALAVAVRQQQDLAGAVARLARQYPRASIARRLDKAAARIAAGTAWTTALRSAGLLGAAEAAVLEAAQRVGNLAWALDEMADSTLRRLVYRLRIGIGILFPLAIVGYGLLAMVIVVGLLLPLIAMIQGLS